jgi:hypothetical protein
MTDAKDQARLAKALEAAMPKPQERRTAKMLLSLLPSEMDRIVAYAEGRGEPPAVAARNLLLASLAALGY